MKLETYGLPPCLHIPTAAASVEVLENYVGKIINRRVSRAGRINALLVEPHLQPTRTPNVPLWEHPQANEWALRLHPPQQVWVHVDYHGYRAVWKAFGMADPGSDFLDHILNRRAMRLRNYSHPYLRLCPVSRHVNTSGGGRHGGEGRETDFMKNLDSYSAGIVEEMWASAAIPLRLADPMDLTKMLNVSPGAVTLDGVRDLQYLFYL